MLKLRSMFISGQSVLADSGNRKQATEWAKLYRTYSSARRNGFNSGITALYAIQPFYGTDACPSKVSLMGLLRSAV